MTIEKQENGKELTLILAGRLDTTTAPMLETELKDTDHKLVLRISKKKNPASQGTECQIRNFVVNGR